MVDLRLLVDLVASLAGAAVCAVVGGVLWRRASMPRAGADAAPFAWGWIGIALSQAGLGAADALVAGGVGAFWPFRVVYLATLLGLALALGAFVLHGLRHLPRALVDARWAWLAGTTYFVFFGMLTMLGMDAASIREPGLSIDLPRAGPVLVGALMVSVLAPFLVPVVTHVGVIARGHRATRQGRSARYRAVLITCSFLLAAYTTFGISLTSMIEGGAAFEIGLLVVSLVAPLAVLMAYRPPEGIREMLHVEAPSAPAPQLMR